MYRRLPPLVPIAFALTLAFAPGAFGQSTVKPSVNAVMQDGSGRLHVLVGVDHGTAPTPSFVVRRKGAGASTIASVTHLATSRPRAVMVLLFDQSGSFKDFRAPAAVLAERFVNAIPSGQPFRIAVMTFGLSVKLVGEATDVAGAVQLIQQAQKAAVEDKTRLHSSVASAIDKAHAMLAAPVGDRHVVVFSDAGEESNVAPLVKLDEHAFEHATRVSSVILGKQKVVAVRTLDELKNLAESSGGGHVAMTPSASAVENMARSVDDQHWLVVDVCGVPSAAPRFADDLVAELSSPPRSASRPRAFSLRVLPQHTVACPAASASPSASASASAAPTPLVLPPTNNAPPTPFPPWLAALGLGVLGLGFLPLLRKRPAPSADNETATDGHARESSDVARAPSQSFPEPRVWMPGAPIDPFDLLPELHLVLRRPDGVDRRVAVRAKRLRVGRGPDCELVVGDDPSLSPQHLLLEFDADGGAYVTDTSSAGSFILRAQTQRLTPSVRVPLPLGVTVSLANACWLRIARPDEPEASTPAVPAPLKPASMIAPAQPAPAQPAPAPPQAAPAPTPTRKKLRYDPTGGAGQGGA